MEKCPQVTTVDFKIKSITLKGKAAKLYIWDTAGQEKYRAIVSTYFKGCHGILLIFDVSKYWFALIFIGQIASKMQLILGIIYANQKHNKQSYF